MLAKNFLRYPLSLLFISVLSLNGLELPQMISAGAAPEIIDFTLYRPNDMQEGAYALIWDTKNATKVVISTLGEVTASGKYIVKSPDPGVDEIVLTVSNNDDFKPVSKTVYVKQPPPLGITHTQEKKIDNDYFPMSPMRQRMLVPLRIGDD